MSVTSIKRKSRNESEKKRRDAFNRLISELTVLVANGERKLDKSSVLKSAINFLKSRQPQAESTTQDLRVIPDPGARSISEQNPRRLAQLYMDTLNAGTFCIDYHGKIHQASSAFAALFGYTVGLLKEQNFKLLLDEDSRRRFDEALSSEMVHMTQACSSLSVIAEFPVLEIAVIDKRYRNLLLMTGRLKRVTGTRTDVVDSCKSPLGITEKQLSDGGTSIMSSTSSICYVGIARPVNFGPTVEIRSEQFLRCGKATGFSVTYNDRFQFLQADHNFSVLLGYTLLEVIGESGYDFVHHKDLEVLSKCHKRLKAIGTCKIDGHRLRTKGKEWIWLNCAARTGTSQDCQKIFCVYSIIDKPIAVEHVEPEITTASSRNPQKDGKDNLPPLKSPSASLYLSSTPTALSPKTKLISSTVSSPSTSEPLPKKPYLISALRTKATASSFDFSREENGVIISPTYRRLWEELQKRSDSLRQQVLQKEIELQQLQFREFFSTCRNVML